MEPIGLEHFFDAFSLDRKRSLKVDAAAALHIPLKPFSCYPGLGLQPGPWLKLKFFCHVDIRSVSDGKHWAPLFAKQAGRIGSL